MCGDLGPGQSAHTVCVRLGANETEARVSVGKRLEHVVEVWLDEYAIDTPNGGGIAPDMWRIKVLDNLYPKMTTNATGTGHPILVDNATYTHHEYQRPRVLSEQNKASLNFIQLQITDNTGAPVVFTSMTLFLTIITQDPTWSPDRVLAQKLLLPVDRIANDAQIPGFVPYTLPQLRQMLQQ